MGLVIDRRNRRTHGLFTMVVGRKVYALTLGDTPTTSITPAPRICYCAVFRVLSDSIPTIGRHCPTILRHRPSSLNLPCFLHLEYPHHPNQLPTPRSLSTPRQCLRRSHKT